MIILMVVTLFQGIPISSEGILTELLTISNILSVNFIKVSSMCKPQELKDDLCFKIMKTLRRGKLLNSCWILLHLLISCNLHYSYLHSLYATTSSVLILSKDIFMAVNRMSFSLGLYHEVIT